MKDTLENLLMVKNMVGFSAQGSANCSALGYAKNIAERYVVPQVEPTVDSRAEWEDSVNTEMEDWLLDQSGKTEEYNPWEELNKYAFIIQSLDLPKPTLEKSLEYLVNMDFTPPSKKDIAELVGEVRDEFKTEAEAEAFVLESLQEEHKNNCSKFEELGSELIFIVEAMVANAQPVPLPDSFKEKLSGFAKKAVDRQRERRGLVASLGDCKLLKLLIV
tara:strand:- start:148 stop:801 length:654 start_codon:yes stop_codon:yes gene_type:complete